MTAEGCADNVIDGFDALASLPVGAEPVVLVCESTVNTAISDPPLSGTSTILLSLVIPPDTGLEPVEMVAGDSAVSAPVLGLYLYCEISFDNLSTT